MYNFLVDINLLQLLPITLYTNNCSAIALAQSMKGHFYAKHINIWHHYICKCVQQGDVSINSIPSTKNYADLFTKLLTCGTYEYLIGIIGLST